MNTVRDPFSVKFGGRVRKFVYLLIFFILSVIIFFSFQYYFRNRSSLDSGQITKTEQNTLPPELTGITVEPVDVREDENVEDSEELNVEQSQEEDISPQYQNQYFPRFLVQDLNSWNVVENLNFEQNTIGTVVFSKESIVIEVLIGRNLEITNQVTCVENSEIADYERIDSFIKVTNTQEFGADVYYANGQNYVLKGEEGFEQIVTTFLNPEPRNPDSSIIENQELNECRLNSSPYAFQLSSSHPLDVDKPLLTATVKIKEGKNLTPEQKVMSDEFFNLITLG